MSSSPPITVEEVRRLREALAHGDMGATAVVENDIPDLRDRTWWHARLIGRWSMDRAEARANLARRAHRIADLVLEQAAEIERLRAVVEAAREYVETVPEWDVPVNGESLDDQQAAFDDLEDALSALDTKEPR